MLVSQKSRTKLEEMLQVGKVDVGNDTLFGIANKREARKTGLTLVISTGGSGMSSIRKAMSIANQKLDAGYKNYVKFIVVDSATGEVSAMKKSGITTLNISSPGAQKRLEWTARKEFFKKFMPKDYDIALLNDDGAAQDRMTGRVKLYDEQSGSTNDTLFRKMIQDLFRGDWSAYKDLPVDIMILSGLSGGNGSGTFIDLAAHARAACPNPAKVHVYGYLMLPDTAERFANTDAARRTLHRNGFAALKELESYMSLGFNTERREEIISMQSANDVTLSAVNLPIDYPVLISGKYDDAVDMIGETIVNLVADSEGKFDQGSFYSNRSTYVKNALSRKEVSENGLLKNGASPEDSHMYCGIGFSQASIPEKIVIPNIIGKVCDKLYVKDAFGVGDDPESSRAWCTPSRKLNKVDFEKQIRRLFGFENVQQLQAGTLYSKIYSLLRSVSTLKANDWDITYRDLVNGEFNEYLDGFHVEQVRIEATDRMRAELDKLVVNFKAEAQNVMRDFGPRAMQYLYDGTGQTDENGVEEDMSGICIRRLLETAATEITKLSQKPGRYPGRIEPVGPIGRLGEAIMHSRVDKWKGDAAGAAQQDVYSKAASAMAGPGGLWKTEYTSRIEGFISECVRFADVVETMTDFYKGEGKSLDSADFEEFSHLTGEENGNGVNLCSDANVYRWVKDRVAAKVSSVKMEEVREALITDFIQNSDQWLSDDVGKARGRYDAAMSRICAIGKYADVASGLHLGITDYFAEVLRDVPADQQQVKVNNVVEQLMRRLLQSSAPSLEKIDGSFDYKNCIILVPQSLLNGEYGKMVEQAFRAKLKDSDTFAGSSVVDAIVCYQASVAIALSDLKAMDLWENDYEASANETMHRSNGERVSRFTERTKTKEDYERGRKADPEQVPVTPEDDHLGGVGLSWRHYPSVNIRRYQNNFNDPSLKTTESEFRRSSFRQKVEYALKEKVLEEEVQGNVYRYYLNRLPDDWDNLRVSGYGQKSGGKYIRGKKLFDFLAGQNPGGEQDYRRQVVLTGSSFFDESGFDFSEIIRLEHWPEEKIRRTARSYMMRALRKNTLLYQQMEETLYRYYDIRRQLETAEVETAAQAQAELFANLYAYGVVRSDSDLYEWNVQINDLGGNIPLLTFGRKTTARFTGLVKGLYGDDLRLVIAYGKFRELLQNREFSEESLQKVKEGLIDRTSEKDLDASVEANKTVLEKELNRYREILRGGRDEVGALMDRYHMDNDQIDDADQVVRFYAALEEELPNI